MQRFETCSAKVDPPLKHKSKAAVSNKHETMLLLHVINKLMGAAVPDDDLDLVSHVELPPRDQDQPAWIWLFANLLRARSQCSC